MTVAALLDVKGLSVGYGGLMANDDISIAVQRGAVVGLIGPNGAGKTTFIDAVSGIARLTSGTIALAGEPIHGLRPHQRARRRLTRSFQAAQLFDDLTIRENLQVAADRVGWTSVRELARPSAKRADDALWALPFLGLEGSEDKLPSELPHGQRRLADVARALASRPQLVLLDEPAAGLDRDESRRLGVRIREMAKFGITVLLVEHDMGLVLDVCDDIYVLEFGRLIAQGTPSEVRSDPRVIQSYLGSRHGSPALGQTTPRVTA